MLIFKIGPKRLIFSIREEATMSQKLYRRVQIVTSTQATTSNLQCNLEIANLVL
jgi:hypothetical protein